MKPKAHGSTELPVQDLQRAIMGFVDHLIILVAPTVVHMRHCV